jgi:hypothetical protein
MASEAVKAAIARAAVKYGVDPQMLMRFAQIESGMRPNARTGSYKGLLQLSDEEFRKAGGQGSIYDVEANANAGAAKLKREMGQFKAKHGRDPAPSDLYMVHQQGEAGYGAHMAKPDGVAWQNVRPYYTDEAARAKGFRDGDAYAKAAIWGNVPDQFKAQYGSVDNMTSKQFTDMWAAKVNDGKFDPGTMVASAQPSTGSASGSSTPTAPQEDKGMLNLLAALGGSGSAMAGLGKGLGMQGMAQAGGQNSVFGALGSLFGGGGGSEGGGGMGGDSGASLAQNAMTAAAGSPEEEQQKGLQRKPIDLQMLSKILQQRAALGTGGVKPGGLGVG